MSTSSNNSQSEWPSFYPDNILLPPEDATDTCGTLFRLTIASPPENVCFQSTHEEQPERYKKFLKKPKLLPNVYATSFFDTYEAAEHMKRVFPSILGNKYIAKGNVIPMIGKMKKTSGPNHYSVWIRNNTSIHTSFSVKVK
ncbi:hypothetical protein [uncultured Psychromonas sp.]|uniref:hypothetical protein n=1 Tax=uncultured Psychromonas sp. TaxID=173974 RepID=UPI00263745A8|nr:hypothetical protein [uncultured Psychromonas sp.]